MTESDALTDGFEQNRTRLRAVAYRMLGSLAEADDAVQETWLRLRRSDASGVDNLGAWLTTIVARVCLNVLRSRKTQREEPMGVHVPDPVISRADGMSPEEQVLLADSVGLALQVVLETLTPAERLAFVLHDLFDLPFDEIAPIVGRTAATARQLASRARRRVRGAGVRAPDPDTGRQREVVDAFFAAARRGDFDALVAVLDPDVVLRVDGGQALADASARVQGAAAVAGQALMFDQPAALIRPALVNGAAGAVVTVDGRPFAVLAFTVSRGMIAEIDILGDPERLLRLDLAVLGGPGPEAGWAKLGAEPGLCLTCRHARLNQTRRGTAYLRCGRSAWDDRLVRYPRLPVWQCAGFEARETEHGAGTTDRSAENLRPEPGAAAGGPCGARARIIAGGNTGSAGIDCPGA
jgi:RNA polymerase sigma-70 factor (ECF subfamily)